MRVSQAYIQAFTSQLETLNKQAGRVIVSETAKLDLEKALIESDDYAFEEVIKLMNRLVPGYSRLSSALTCHFYDGIRDAAGVPGEFKAEVYETMDKKQLTAAARKIAEEVEQGRNTKPLGELLADENTYWTRRASNETVRRNAKRDPSRPKYAIVPGVGACAFCLMRASNGYVYPDQTSVESHKNCNCQAVQVYGNGTIQGYDPDAYAEQYYNAKEAWLRGDVSDDLLNRIADAESRNPNFDETNAILMVWREQQGIK